MRRKILDQKGLNFLTMTLVDWVDLFTRKVYCDMIIDSLAYCRKKKGLLIYGYVIMPSHLHLISIHFAFHSVESNNPISQWATSLCVPSSERLSQILTCQKYFPLAFNGLP